MHGPALDAFSPESTASVTVKTMTTLSSLYGFELFLYLRVSIRV